MTQDTYIGVLPDPRTEAEQARDYQATELASAEAMVPKFRTVKEGKWKKYTVRDQDGSGSCVSQALAKNFEVLRKLNKNDTIVYSATPIYQKRRGKPSPGMYGPDALNIAVKTGTCPEANLKSQLLDDAEMDSLVIPTNFEDLNNSVDALASLVMPKDFDYVAAAIEKWGVAMIHIAADRKSWSKDFPSLGSANRGIRHAVAGVDAVTYNKVKYIVIDDSWGEFGKYKGQRLLSREVFNDMVTFCGGLVSFAFDVKDALKKYQKFETVLEYGQNSSEVKRVQEVLKDKGFFPSNEEATGYYGNITAKAVYTFQVKHSVAPLVELNELKGRRIGAKTLSKLNLLYV